MEKWKTLRSDYLYKTPFGNLRKDCCELPNGNVIEDYYVNEHVNWVNAVVITKSNQLILVEQFRQAGNDFFLEIPAGKMEANETSEEAIIREVKEETGYISEAKPILLGEFMVNPATQNNLVITYLIVDAYQACEQDLDENEEIRVKLFDFDGIDGMIKDKVITQLFTVNAYLLAKDYLAK